MTEVNMTKDLRDLSAAAAIANDRAEVLDGQILALVSGSQAISSDERRVRERFPISCKMLLTPIDHHLSPLTDENAFIFGKDLSRSGICFSHDFPLTHRRIIIALVHPEVGQFKVEAEVSWTRSTPIGLYETGCRLIRKVS